MPGDFKLFECGKELFNNLIETYERTYMENAKDKYWTGLYDTITKYKYQNHTPSSNVKNREAIVQVMR